MVIALGKVFKEMVVL